MDTMQLTSLLGWCLLLNLSLLLLWSGLLLLWADGLYALSRRFVPVEKSTFFTLHYALLGAYKLAIYFFNVMPYVALKYLM